MIRKTAIPAGRLRAFSLIELVAAIAVMITVAALALPAVSGTLSGMKITTAMQTVVEEIQFARATALSHNAPVDVWFLSNSSVFGSVRSSIVNPDSTSQWISRARKLPTSIAFASHEKYSSIIGTQNSEIPPHSLSGTTGVRIRIFPSGRVELVNVRPETQPLSPNDFLYLTIVPSTAFAPGSDADLPPNFATAQVNPVNARVTTYRP